MYLNASGKNTGKLHPPSSAPVFPAGRQFLQGVAAGCRSIGIFPFREGEPKRPRALVGLTDISARKYLRNLLGKDRMRFSIPWTMFLELEDEVEGSFLQHKTWKSLTSSDE
jgi:hypothetical protein